MEIELCASLTGAAQSFLKSGNDCDSLKMHLTSCLSRPVCACVCFGIHFLTVLLLCIGRGTE